jgi:orotidine-5'-phosphate decarboxylase
VAGVTAAADRGAPVPIAALDFATVDQAMALVDELGELCRFYKVGSELFTAAGPAAVAELRGAGCEVMLDLKLHDIPNTVARAVASARRLGANILTVHAAGGRAMLRVAAEVAAGRAVLDLPAEPTGGPCRIFAVTVLTSLDSGSLGRVWGRDAVEIEAEVLRLAAMAREAGVAGVVASGLEVAALRAALGTDFQVLVPGVRLAGSEAADQSRVVTPAEARKLGADYVVVGRTVTSAAGRREAMERVLRELAKPLD